MNLYFLVEGRRTEARVYPEWLSYLLPHYKRIRHFDEATENSYFLISGEGYPSLLDVHLANAIKDVNQSNSYCYLVLCLDADEYSITQRTQEVLSHMHEKQFRLRTAELKIIVQNRCIETWFLGNRMVFSRAPQSQRLRDFISFYDIRIQDPELMGCYLGYHTHADFHGDYLKEMLRERGVLYSKQHPRHVTDQAYLQQLLLRIQDTPGGMSSFQSFVTFCQEIAMATGFQRDAL